MCGQTEDTHTDRCKPIYNLYHAICYSYGADKKLSVNEIISNLNRLARKGRQTAGVLIHKGSRDRPQ